MLDQLIQHPHPKGNVSKPLIVFFSLTQIRRFLQKFGFWELINSQEPCYLRNIHIFEHEARAGVAPKQRQSTAAEAPEPWQGAR